jgi:hypothetical protein
MADPYDNPPQGFRRANKGWLLKNPTPGAKKLRKLEEENTQMKALIEEMAARLDKLEE